jgi:hypothetical protein
MSLILCLAQGTGIIGSSGNRRGLTQLAMLGERVVHRLRPRVGSSSLIPQRSLSCAGSLYPPGLRPGRWLRPSSPKRPVLCHQQGCRDSSPLLEDLWCRPCSCLSASLIRAGALRGSVETVSGDTMHGVSIARPHTEGSLHLPLPHSQPHLLCPFMCTLAFVSQALITWLKVREAQMGTWQEAIWSSPKTLNPLTLPMLQPALS